MRKQFLFACIFILNGYLFAQSDTLVQTIVEHSRKAEEQGNFDYAVELMLSNVRTYKKSPGLRKELASLYYRGEEFRKSLRQCRRFLRKFYPDEDIYQLKAHNHLNLGKPNKAKKTLSKGLEELPQAGLLFAEKGRLSMHLEKYEEAINWFEEGIANAPNYSGNYYWAAKIYCQSTEELWGLYYGEIFMNLEQFTSRTREMSSLLFETLNREIVFYNDTAISVNLCKDANFNIPIEDTADYTSYGQDIIEPLYKDALKGISHLSITNINKFRITANSKLNTIEKGGYQNHVLLDFHNELVDNGHFEAYNFWLYMMGNPDEFEAWERDNSSQWKLFIRWFENYDFSISPDDAYYSKQFR